MGSDMNCIVIVEVSGDCKFLGQSHWERQSLRRGVVMLEHIGVTKAKQ